MKNGKASDMPGAPQHQPTENEIAMMQGLVHVHNQIMTGQLSGLAVVALTKDGGLTRILNDDNTMTTECVVHTCLHRMMTTITGKQEVRERADRDFQSKQTGVRAASEYAKEQILNKADEVAEQAASQAGEGELIDEAADTDVEPGADKDSKAKQKAAAQL